MPGLLRRTIRALAVVVAAAILFLSWSDTLHAEAPILSAPDVAERVASGEFVLLDIRSPEEWADSGVAEGAWPVSMHVDDFPQRLSAILQQYDPSQIGLICATGSRSNYITQWLEQNGVVGINDVSEGMFGNPKGAGWIARGLPVVSADEATARYDQARSTWAE